MDIKFARSQYDCRVEIERCLGPHTHKTAKSLVWHCPFHQEDTPSFHVYAEGYHCYGCGVHGDVFDWLAYWEKKELKEILLGHSIDPQAELQRKSEYAARAATRLENEIQKAQSALREIRELQSWITYHNNLEADDKARVIWESNGIPDWYQDWMQLGYDPRHHFWAGGDYYSATLTIPIYEPETRNVLNIKHRILGEASEKLGKYRPEKSGLPAHLFPASPDLPISGRVMAVEGEKKAMVAYVTLADPSMQVVGLPSKNPNEMIIKQLSKCDEVILCLDPDADPRPVAKEIGPKTRIIRLADKLDDYIMVNELDGDWLRGQIKQARRM